MFKKTLIHLSCLGLLLSLAACSDSADNSADPAPSESVAAPSTPSEPPVVTSPSPPSSELPASNSPSPEPTSSEDPATTDEIPPALRGKWVTVEQGQTPRECTEELGNEGAILTIDATTMSSFAFLFQLESIEESSDDSIVGLFRFQGDSDQPATPRIKLETTDDWQSFELIELDTEGQDQELYARCA